MSKKGWLSKEDFENLDNLFGKMGYGGYYDFLQCLKNIASNIGAVYVKGGAWDLEEIKTIYEMMAIIQHWSNKISLLMIYEREISFKSIVLGLCFNMAISIGYLMGWMDTK